LIIVAVLAILVIQKEKNVMTTLVALWALYGIQQNNLHSGIDDDIWLACTLLLVLLSLYLFAFIFKISKKGGLN
jgi:hypothetical protein